MSKLLKFERSLVIKVLKQMKPYIFKAKENQIK